MRVYAYVFLSFFILGGGIDCYANWQSRKATFIWWPWILETIKNKYWYQYLQSEFKRYGYHLEHQNIHFVEDSKIVIWAYPRGDLTGISSEQYVVGWMMESPISLKQPLSDEDSSKFDLILTWRKDLIDHKKSFFIPIFTRIEDINPKFWQEPKSVLISQIASAYTGGVYNERSVAAKWFLENVPSDFKLYGDGWDSIKSNLSKKAQIAFEHQYGGYVNDKLKAVSQSKFVLAYENAIHDDYVTEKIYDVLQAGAVPVYLGAPNIEQYVPKNCFVNKNDFETYDELYTFLKNMDDKTYESYRQCAYDFVQQDEVQQANIIKRVVHYIFDKKEKDFADMWNKFWVDVMNFIKFPLKG